MNVNRKISLSRCLAVLLVASLPVAGCDVIGDSILGKNYGGPPPAAQGIPNEVAIVRLVEVVPSGQTVLLIDRVRYVEAGQPHDVNRVVRVVSGETLREAVAAQSLNRGDQVVISTEYQGVVTGVGSMTVPDWPGHKAYEYPIGLHSITAISRLGTDPAP
jgi:hypothetical protein